MGPADDNQSESTGPAPTLSFGDIAVGRSFNPSGNTDVETFKKEIAMFLDSFAQLKPPVGMTDAESELYAVFVSTTVQAAITAQMFSVKAATFMAAANKA
jgi:hypothetical protein